MSTSCVGVSGRWRCGLGLASWACSTRLDSALVVAVGQGGAITVVVTALVAWLRRRVGTLSVKVTVGDRSVEVSSENVRGLTAEQVRSLVNELSESITESVDGQAT
jgi:hypothetical protein